MNPDGEDKKNVKLNLNAGEYKPKTFNPSQNQQQTQNPYNPYTGMTGYNMYNQYGGMYGNQMNQIFQGQNYDLSNQMYDPYTMQPNMNQNLNQQLNPNVNTPTQKTEQKTGIPGLGKKNVKTTQQTQPQQTQQNTNINFNQNIQQQPQQQGQQPKVQQQNQPQQKLAAKKDIQPVKKEQKKDEIKEITKKVEEIKIDSKLEEVVLVDDAKEGSMTEIDYTRKPATIVFIGHVDAGKSTISGNILYKTGQIDERTIEKYQREAKANNRESWFIAYIMDVNEEERERGKTVEVGKAFFETAHKRFTILDAPGHSGFVPNMLQGACQADYAGLVISAKMGEFEAGFKKTEEQENMLY